MLPSLAGQMRADITNGDWGELETGLQSIELQLPALHQVPSVSLYAKKDKHLLLQGSESRLDTRQQEPQVLSWEEWHRGQAGMRKLPLLSSRAF